MGATARLDEKNAAISRVASSTYTLSSPPKLTLRASGGCPGDAPAPLLKFA